ncbi:MAG: response regulator [Candidatus Nanopelagicales bacterium]
MSHAGMPTVVLVDDHPLVRSGLRAQLGAAVRILAEAADVAAAIAAVVAEQPAVVILDVHLPSGNGVDVLHGVGGRAPGTRWLALSVSDSAADVVAVVRAGAHGYVTKSISARDLLDAVVRVAAGDAVFSPRLAGFVLDSFRAQPVVPPAAGPADAELDQLTDREREVLTYIARGYTYKEVAGELFLSVRTVESHVSAVLRKLQLSNRRELSRWATARRLV